MAEENIVVPGTEGFVDQERLQAREQNLTIVREAMELADKVNAGDKLREGVEIDFATDLDTYKGYVKFKRPAVRDYIKMGAHKAQILQANFIDENGNLQKVDPSYIDDATHYAAQVLATLHFVVVQDENTPVWLRNMDSQYDFDILAYVYGRFTEWTNSFRTTRTAKSEGNSEATK